VWLFLANYLIFDVIH